MKWLVLRCKDCRTIEIRTPDEDLLMHRRCRRQVDVGDWDGTPECQGPLELLFEVQK
jgi:hypothetical protein